MVAAGNKAATADYDKFAGRCFMEVRQIKKIGKNDDFLQLSFSPRVRGKPSKPKNLKTRTVFFLAVRKRDDSAGRPPAIIGKSQILDDDGGDVA